MSHNSSQSSSHETHAFNIEYSHSIGKMDDVQYFFFLIQVSGHPNAWLSMVNRSHSWHSLKAKEDMDHTNLHTLNAKPL